MRWGWLTLLAAFVIFRSAYAGDWDVIHCAGRDYLTLDNISQFYGLGAVSHVSNSLVLGSPGRGLRGAVGSNEFYINNLKFILSYPILEEKGELLVSRMDLTKVIEPVLRPSRIRNAGLVDTIVLDPGHGGADNGATSLWGNEKNFALDVACRAKDLLIEQGFEVKMTRSSDVFIPLEERVRFANQFQNALFISIHFNSGGGAASGLETYTLAPRGVPSMAADGPSLSDLQLCAGNAEDSANMALATATHASLVYHLQMYDRGIKRARFVVIRDINIPGVLVEGGFLSNSEDSRKIATSAYRQQMANCILAAVQNYRAAVGNPLPVPSIAGIRSLELKNLVESVSARGAGDAAQSLEAPPRSEPLVITPSSN